MKNKSDTNMLRHYCNLHRGKIFDMARVNKQEFPNYPDNVFRKYVSRLVIEGYLLPIDRGIYFIGNELPTNIDEMILRHHGASNRIHYGNSLLFEVGIIDEKPEFEEVFCMASFKNRRVRNFAFKGLQTFLDDAPKYLVELIELISLQNDIPEDNEFIYFSELKERLLKYKDEDLNRIKPVYRRIVYVRLANLLDQLHISNKVKSWYGHYKGLSY